MFTAARSIRARAIRARCGYLIVRFTHTSERTATCGRIATPPLFTTLVSRTRQATTRSRRHLADRPYTGRFVFGTRRRSHPAPPPRFGDQRPVHRFGGMNCVHERVANCTRRHKRRDCRSFPGNMVCNSIVGARPLNQG